MWKVAIFLTLLLVMAACSGNDTGSTATAGTTPTTAVAAKPPPATSGAEATTITVEVAPSGGGVTDCFLIWREGQVQDIAGPDYTFFQANADKSACIYEALPGSIALAFRPSDLAGFEAGRTGAGSVATVNDMPICDGGYYIELPEAGILMETFSADPGRVYTATLTGMGIEEATQWAGILLSRVCGV